MIFAFSNDYSVTVFDDVQQANSYCEGIDVEDGVYTFTDERGFVFTPRNITPGRRGRLFGLLFSAAPGPFTLEPTAEQRLDLLTEVVAGRISVCPGPTRLGTREALQDAFRGQTLPPTEPRV